MRTKRKTLIITTAITLFFPMFVFAASTEWGAGVTVDNSGNLGVSLGVGSAGSGAGNVWGSATYGTWALSNPYGLPSGSILGIASNLLFWLLAIFAIMGIVGFLISGIIYLVSAGDENTISRAKSTMKWSIVGIIVGLSGFLIMQAISALLSGGSSKF